MEPEQFSTKDPDGLTIVAFRWLPESDPRAAIHLMHGRGEHARRYDRLASDLVAAGFAVYADDHRGHGQTGLANGGLGLMGPGGPDGVVEAVHAVTDRIRGDFPDLPIIAIGHSWGSFILYRYLQLYGRELAAALLTGTTRRDPAAPRPTRGAGRPATPFEGRTRYDWLTRDQREVDKYIADPLCGFEAVRAPEGAAPADTAPGGDRPRPEGDDSSIPADLPILVLNGADDPIGGEEGGRRLVDHLRSLGIADVALKAYPGARHELFNEINRDEVVADVVAWLDRHSPAS